MSSFRAEAGMQSWKLPSPQNFASEHFPSAKNIDTFYSDSFFLLKLPAGIIASNSNTANDHLNKYH